MTVSPTPPWSLDIVGHLDPATAERLAARLNGLSSVVGIGAQEIVALPAGGVAHAHYRLGRRGLLLRVPLATPWAGEPATALDYEAACFARAAPSGATPVLHGVIAPDETLPRGALVVEEIIGRPPRLPADYPSIANALAQLHGEPVPPSDERAPLADHAGMGPIRATWRMIAACRTSFDAIDLVPESRAALAAELTWAEAYAAAGPDLDQPIALVGTDTHPGNFLIRPDGAAILVDLERVAYGSAAFDLAHASLPTSTLWHRDVQATVTPADVARFQAAYLGRVEPSSATRLRPLLANARRLVWLRTMMWYVRWQGLMTDPAMRPSDEALARHVDERIRFFLRPDTISAARSEWLPGSHATA